jgi:hypothetical protein
MNFHSHICAPDMTNSTHWFFPFCSTLRRISWLLRCPIFCAALVPEVRTGRVHWSADNPCSFSKDLKSIRNVTSGRSVWWFLPWYAWQYVHYVSFSWSSIHSNLDYNRRLLICPLRAITTVSVSILTSPV